MYNVCTMYIHTSYDTELAGIVELPTPADSALQRLLRQLQAARTLSAGSEITVSTVHGNAPQLQYALGALFRRLSDDGSW